MNEVIELIAARAVAGSRPGERADSFRVALGIEGGGNRAAYGAGMALALEELGLVNAVDAIYGTSGGALNAAWLAAGQGRDYLTSWAWPEVAAARVNDIRRGFRGRPAVDLRILVEHVYTAVTPMDFDAILANPISLHPLATDTHSGEAVDLAPHIIDRGSLQTALRASACLPLLAGRPVHLGGCAYVDGGLSEAVPCLTPIAQGATHVLVLRTRPAGQHARPSRLEQWALAGYFRHHAPGAGRSHGARSAKYRSIDELLEATDTASGPRLAQIRPPADAPHVGRLSRDLATIAKAVEIGRQAAYAALGHID